MNQQRVVWPRPLDQPVHSPQDIGFGRDAQLMLLVVGEDHHVFSPVTMLLMEEHRHIRDIIDAAMQFARLTDVVYAD